MPHPGAFSTGKSAQSHAGGGTWPCLPVAPHTARVLVKGLVARAAAIVKGSTRGGVVVGAADNRFPTVQYSARGDMPDRQNKIFMRCNERFFYFRVWGIASAPRRMHSPSACTTISAHENADRA